MSFQLPITIADVIQGIQTNDYVLPAIQREFVWNARQIEKLFDSLMRGYPIGSFLFWKVAPDKLGEFQFYRFMDRYHQRDYRHNEKIALIGQHSVIAVLDGQQRLTALNIGLKGWYADKLPYYHWTSNHAFPRRRLHLNLLGPADDIEFEYNFRMLRERDVENAGDHEFWFSVSQVFEFQEIHEVYDFCHDNGLTQRDTKFPYKTLMKLWEVVHKEKVVNYFLEQEQDLDKVLNIFIRVNSGGTPLSYSDMLLSIATAQWEERDAREEIHGLVDTLNDIGDGFNFNKDFVLKASLVLTDIRAIEFKVNNFNRHNMLLVEEHWNEIVHALQMTARLLARWGYNRETLVSNYSAIPLAYYLYKHDAPGNFVESSRFSQEREDMHYWLILALLRRTFSGQPDNVLRTIRDVLREAADGFPVGAIREALAGTTKSLAFDEAALEGLMGYQYNQSYTFSVLALLYPWLKYDQRFHKDHIFPRGMFKEKELARRNIPPEHWHLWLDNVDSLANLQLLQAIPNQEKSDTEPETWLQHTFLSEDERTAYRQRHLIPDIPLVFENFPRFFAARQELMEERLGTLLKVKQSSRRTITIDSTANDDWMKSLPGYEDELAIHDTLAEKSEREKKEDGYRTAN